MEKEIKRCFSDDEYKVFIKDSITLVMSGMLLSETDIEKVKKETYRLVADTIKEIDEHVNDLGDLVIEAMMSCREKRKIIDKKCKKGENDEMEL